MEGGGRVRGGYVAMQPMRIVILSVAYDPFMSGAEQMAKAIVDRLGSKYELFLITARFDKSLPKYERRAGFTLLRVGIGHKVIDKFLFPVLAALRAKALNPDISHAILESYAGVALLLLKLFHSPAKRILTLQSGGFDQRQKSRRLHIRFFWKAIHRSPDYITAISRSLAKRAIALGVPKERIAILPNGVDFSEVPQNPSHTPDSVFCMGRLTWEKGIDDLLAAWPAVINKIPQARLRLFGEGPKKDEVDDLIRRLDISASVELHGNLPHKDFLKEMAKAEIFILPSLAEGLGIVFIEAQACGLAVIGTNVGGIPDVIQHMENGILVEPKNSAAISNAIILLLENKQLARTLRDKALQTVKRFDWNIIISTLESLYKQAINGAIIS